MFGRDAWPLSLIVMQAWLPHLSARTLTWPLWGGCLIALSSKFRKRRMR